MGDPRPGRSVWAEIPIRLFLVSLGPLALIIPARLVRFPDTDPLTFIVLGPAFEESLKLASAVLALTLASLAFPGGRDPVLALRYWIFLVPWIVGGGFGLFEGFLGYPYQVGSLLTLREAAHATFLVLSMAAALEVWRSLRAPFVGIWFGLGAGLAGHIGFNILAVFTAFDPWTVPYLAIYLGLVLVYAVPALVWEIRRVPASKETRAFLPERSRGLHP